MALLEFAPVTTSARVPSGFASEGERLDSARSKNDPGSRGKLKRRYQASSSGNTFANCMLVRGSAIISATVSRQTW